MLTVDQVTILRDKVEREDKSVQRAARELAKGVRSGRERGRPSTGVRFTKQGVAVDLYKLGHDAMAAKHKLTLRACAEKLGAMAGPAAQRRAARTLLPTRPPAYRPPMRITLLRHLARPNAPPPAAYVPSSSPPNPDARLMRLARASRRTSSVPRKATRCLARVSAV